MINGEELHSSASIGITLFPADGQTAERLLKNAELAMYRAKSNGRDGSCFFAPQMNLVARRTGLLERELRQAFAAEQFTVHYQPQRDLKTGQIVGIEALLRWRHPRRGMVRPSEFIGLAEDIGLIAPADRARARTAPAASSGCGSTPACRPLRLSVNLSPVQFREGAVVTLIESTLAETGIEPELPRDRADRGRDAREQRDRAWPACATSTSSASASRSTTSAPATPRWPTSSGCRCSG